MKKKRKRNIGWLEWFEFVKRQKEKKVLAELSNIKEE